jgi:homoserine kinase type II
VWAGTPASGPCPAVRRRAETVREWLALVQSGWRPEFASSEADPIRPWSERAWQLLQIHCHRIPERLAPWVDHVWPLQPCLCDVWHDHLLFEGETLTGIVDYGGVKLDHVAVDLARLLGSMAGDDRRLRSIGLQAYTRLRPFSPAEEELIRVLDETGTLLGMANWLKWLYRDGRFYEDRSAVARRLAALVERLESW